MVGFSITWSSFHPHILPLLVQQRPHTRLLQFTILFSFTFALNLYSIAWVTYGHRPRPPVYYCLTMLTVILTRLDTWFFSCFELINLFFINLRRTQFLKRCASTFARCLIQYFCSQGMLGQYSLSPSPKSWGMPLSIQTEEPDDYLHNPDPSRDRDRDRGGHICTARGIANLGCLLFLGAGIMMLLYGIFHLLREIFKELSVVILCHVVPVCERQFQSHLYYDRNVPSLF